MDLSIIIVNYNGEKFLKPCYESIVKNVSVKFEIIIVDNNSTDNSVQFIESHLSDVKLIKSEYNLGFSGGNNLGCNVAEGKYLLLLNNDTVLTSDVKRAIEIMEHTCIGVVGGNLNYGDNRLQYSIGFEHTPLNILLSWIPFINSKLNKFCRVNTIDEHYISEQRNLSWVSGAYLYTPKAIWEKVNGLDDTYFMYIEDVDYCKSVRDAGHEICYSPEITAIHYKGGGKNWIGDRAVSWTIDSYKIYLNKYHSYFPSKLSLYCLAVVFLLRGLGQLFISVFCKRELNLEKAKSFLKNSFRLICR
jgi:GT2 family glycosyltransferase